MMVLLPLMQRPRRCSENAQGYGMLVVAVVVVELL